MQLAVEIASAVLEALLSHAAAQEAERVWASVRTPARSLYERAAFEVVSEEFELPVIGPHVVMEVRLAPGDAGSDTEQSGPEPLR